MITTRWVDGHCSRTQIGEWRVLNPGESDKKGPVKPNEPIQNPDPDPISDFTHRMLEAIAAEQEVLGNILFILMKQFQKLTDLLATIPDDIPLKDKVKLIKCLETATARGITSVVAKEEAINGLVKTLLRIPSGS